MRRAIVTGGTKSDVAAMAVLAINIRDTNSDVIDKLIIFHDGIRKRDQRLINDIFETDFLKYSYPGKSTNDEIVNHFSTMVFCKYECLKLLECYDEVAWIDYDVVIKKSLIEAFDFSNSSINYMCGKILLRNMFYDHIENQDIYSYNLNEYGFHASFFAISSKIENKEELYNYCYTKTIEWDSDIYLPEQCILAAMLQKYPIDSKILDDDIFACQPENDKEGVVILHADGQRKFWNGRYNEQWDGWYQNWMELGGTGYSYRLGKTIKIFRLLISRLRGIRKKSHRPM